MRRQLVVESTKTVAQPGAQARHCDGRASRMKLQRGLAVISMIRVHRADESHLVHDLAKVREQIADFRAALFVRSESPQRCL